MNTTTRTQDMMSFTRDNTMTTAGDNGRPEMRSRTALTGKLYCFHGFRVLDANGRSIGTVGWIWSDRIGGQSEVIGVQLHWLRGTARAIPTDGVRVDRENSTIHVGYFKEQIERAPRYAIDRGLTIEQATSIRRHYCVRPALVPDATHQPAQGMQHA